MSDQTETTPDDNNPRGTKALRDAWLKSYSRYAKIGKTYGVDGAVLFEGLSPFEWLQQFKVVSSPQQTQNIGAEALRDLYMKLAEKYNTAASFHANLVLASEALSSELDQTEGQFLKLEIAKYQPGGLYWDEVTKTAIPKRPGAAVLKASAHNTAAQSRAALKMLQREASFFKNCMDNLEYQRRCFKDYSELLALDPATRGLAH